LELYKALHPENTDVTENDVEPITLEAVLMADLYNDVGFRVKDKIFIFVEAQSTWSMNIIIRMFMYLAETYNNYYQKNKQSLYSSKKVAFPKPELYVVYTGERGNKKDVISLSEEFLNGESCSLEIKVNVLYDGKQGDIINQYVEFTKVYQQQLKLHGRTRKAVSETIKICKDKSVLKEYLEKRESEVITIMMTLFDPEVILENYVETEKREARKLGKIGGAIEMCKDLGLSKSETLKRIISKFKDLTKEEAENLLEEYWK
jgi:hypothetical protein